LSPVTIHLDAQFGTPYPRSAGFDTDIGAFIESSSVPSPIGRMPLPVFKDGIFANGALAAGQTIRLGGFLIAACPATASAMTSRVIESNLHVNSEFAEHLDPAELSSVNELLDRIAALGVATDYDQIGLKTDLREINSPQVTHHVTVVEEQCGDSSPILKTRHVRAPKPSTPDSRGGAGLNRALNLKSGIVPDSLDNVQRSKFPILETPRPSSLETGRAPHLVPPTR